MDAVSIAQIGGKEISSDMSALPNTIGGLIPSAVGGFLSATKARDFSAQKTFEKAISSQIISKIAGFVSSLFTVVWMILISLELASSSD